MENFLRPNGIFPARNVAGPSLLSNSFSSVKGERVSLENESASHRNATSFSFRNGRKRGATYEFWKIFPRSRPTGILPREARLKTEHLPPKRLLPLLPDARQQGLENRSNILEKRYFLQVTGPFPTSE